MGTKLSGFKKRIGKMIKRVLVVCWLLSPSLCGAAEIDLFVWYCINEPQDIGFDANSLQTITEIFRGAFIRGGRLAGQHDMPFFTHVTPSLRHPEPL